MIKVGVVGVGGRMGSIIAGGVMDTPGLELAGGSEMPGSPFVGRDLGEVVRRENLGVTVADNAVQAFEACDVIIDFSIPQATLHHVSYAAGHGKSIVIGTTGFSERERAQIDAYGEKTSLVIAPNMSIGVNVMFKAAAMLTELLGEDYDIEIVEAHHRHKKDAPSGTARGLAEAVAAARGVELSDHACYERCGMIGERPAGEIGVQTVRAGDIVGDHTVYFAGGGERIELTHRAHSRENFARGAIRAASWVPGQKPGVYSMLDVLGLS